MPALTTPRDYERRLAQINEQALSQLISKYRLTKGTITSFDSRGTNIDVYKFAINPNSINISGGVDYTDHVAPGMFGGPQQYVKTPNISISFDLFLATRRTLHPFSSNDDNNEIPSIVQDIARIQSWFMPAINEYAADTDNLQFISPPRLYLNYGPHSLPVRGKSWKLNETQHDKQLNAEIATMSVEFVSDFQTTSDVTNYVVSTGIRRSIQ